MHYRWNAPQVDGSFPMIQTSTLNKLPYILNSASHIWCFTRQNRTRIVFCVCTQKRFCRDCGSSLIEDGLPVLRVGMSVVRLLGSMNWTADSLSQ